MASAASKRARTGGGAEEDEWRRAGKALKALRSTFAVAAS